MREIHDLFYCLLEWWLINLFSQIIVERKQIQYTLTFFEVEIF